MNEAIARLGRARHGPSLVIGARRVGGQIADDEVRPSDPLTRAVPLAADRLPGSGLSATLAPDGPEPRSGGTQARSPLRTGRSPRWPARSPPARSPARGTPWRTGGRGRGLAAVGVDRLPGCRGQRLQAADERAQALGPGSHSGSSASGRSIRRRPRRRLVEEIVAEFLLVRHRLPVRSSLQPLEGADHPHLDGAERDPLRCAISR